MTRPANSGPGLGWPAEDELLLYIVHGTLHLVGYDDHDPADLAKMVLRELRPPGRAGYRSPV